MSNHSLQMLSKNEVKYIQSLHHKKFRQQYGECIVEGPKIIHELILRHPKQLLRLYATADWWLQQSHDIRNIVQSYCVEVSPVELEKISALQTPQNVLAITVLPNTNETNSFVTEGWSVALDGIQDPGNLGTIIRTAQWFGIKQIICSMDSADAFSPKVVQASMGSVFYSSIFYTDLSAFFNYCSVPIYGALLEGKPVHTFYPAAEGILLIGNEGKGIRRELLPYIQYPVTITGSGYVESLNAAVAAGILMHAFIQQNIHYM